MTDDTVNVEVNGVACKARKGQMIIHVTDASDVYVPRFCYHDKLTVAANCRMCLVEVEKAPKPMPACATPVTEGMKVFTKSPKAIAAQRATMEFLLINHPLDCPICDQGGECELQDLAMGFGRDISRYSERKRVVKDKNLGSLVSTDMTRCIHCTRCVRFTQEIQGFQQLGTIGRAEFTEIGTFIEQSVDHELSANIIDLCPVGALNNKSFRYRARAWELLDRPMISPHDSTGTNISAHTLRGRVMRVVPRPNEAINETWIADRDRFGFEGMYSEDRLAKPMIREGDAWRETDWETALTTATERLKSIVKQHGAGQLGALASPLATLEEHYLLAKVVRSLGSSNLDHRLRRTDFRDESADPVYPWLGGSIESLEQASSVLVVGANLRAESPLMAHRLRKAALRGAAVGFVNPTRYDYMFPVAGYLASNGLDIQGHLAALINAAAASAQKSAPVTVASLVSSAQPTDAHRDLTGKLASGERKWILLGAIAQRSANFADLRALAAALAEITGAQLGYIADGGNTVGAHLAGVLPHRSAGGRKAQHAGLNVSDMLAAKLKAYVLLGAIEPAQDIAANEALASLRAAECVIALSPFQSAKEFAHIVLPIGTYAETSGTYVNLEGRWQTVPGAANPVAESRPAWKVLRVLGNLLNLTGFEYNSSDEVREELASQIGDVQPDNTLASSRTLQTSLPLSQATGRADVPIYEVDAIVRRSQPLQQTSFGRDGGGDK
jgi:NADH-quinone oxidoreductase subunit G